ncbi:hypothetical protein K9M06_01415 [Candidatus Bipolaricaulota bacterium]|nr:hypothetical protein [Candidatus Bipolaricaulota bacterium]
MKLKEKIPFLGGDGVGIEEQQGRVRLLCKLEDFDSFEVEDFNELVKAAATRMEDKVSDRSVFLGDEVARDLDREDLLEKHLSYRVEVAAGEVTDTGGEDSIHEETTTFKVILRTQPNDAIEINGPHDISSRYKEALKDSFKEHTGANLTFQDIVKD